jgi:hypothetical protein
MESKSSRKSLTPTVVGLAIALFALPVFMATYRAISPIASDRYGEHLGGVIAAFVLGGILTAKCHSAPSDRQGIQL